MVARSGLPHTRVQSVRIEAVSASAHSRESGNPVFLALGPRWSLHSGRRGRTRVRGRTANESIQFNLDQTIDFPIAARTEAA